MTIKNRWVYVTSDIIILAIPKNASTSLLETFPTHIGENMASGYKHRFAFIRHPMERLKSCFAFFYEGLILKTNPHGIFQHESLCEVTPEIVVDWPTFVDYTLENNNPHWDPQTSFSDQVTEWIAFDHMTCNTRLNESHKDDLDWEVMESHFDYRIPDQIEKYDPDWQVYTDAIRKGTNLGLLGPEVGPLTLEIYKAGGTKPA